MRLRVLLVAATVLAVPIALAIPAAASAATVVTTFADLQNAVTAGDSPITLGSDITAATDEQLDVSGHTIVLDLAGHHLSIVSPGAFNAAVVVPSGSSLTIDDSVGTGRLDATGGAAAAAIGGQASEDGGTITISGGTITATGGADGAGIGGGENGAGGDVVITGGSVTADGGSMAAGIGSGNEIGGAGTLDVQGAPTVGSASDGGSSSWVTGGISPTLTNSVEPTGVSYTATSSDAFAGTTTIVFHYTVTVDPNNGDPTTTQTIDYGNTATAPSIVRSGYKLVGWESDGSSFHFSNPITGVITIDAVWQVVLATTGVDPTIPMGIASLLLLAGGVLLIARRQAIPVRR